MLKSMNLRGKRAAPWRPVFARSQFLGLPPLADRAGRRDSSDRGRPDSRPRRPDELLERSELYREIVEKGMPDQVVITRKPLEARGGGACEPSRAKISWRRFSATRGSGRQVRGGSSARPTYRCGWRDVHHVVLADGPARARPAPLDKLAIGHRDSQETTRRARLIVVASWGPRDLRVGRVAQTYLAMGRPAGPRRGSAHQGWGMFAITEAVIGLYSRNRAGENLRMTNESKRSIASISDGLATLVQSG